MSIDWDVVHEQGTKKALDYQFKHSNMSLADAYLAGYQESAGERESLRVMVANLSKKGPSVAEIGTKAHQKLEEYMVMKEIENVTGTPVSLQTLPPSVDDLI